MTVINVGNVAEQMAKYTIPVQNMKFLELEKDPLGHSIILPLETKYRNYTMCVLISLKRRVDRLGTKISNYYRAQI